jgi:DNA-binding transcriptional ArsR family regulator
MVLRVPMGDALGRMVYLRRKHGWRGLEGEAGLGEGELEEYLEWMEILHALGAYRDGEEFECYREEILELDRNSLSKLTPRRIEILDRISSMNYQSINELAMKVGRDIKNVYRDLKVLEGLGFVKLERRGKRIHPIPLLKEITLVMG